MAPATKIPPPIPPKTPPIMRHVSECDVTDGAGAVVGAGDEVSKVEDGGSDSDVMAMEGVIWGVGSVTNVSLTCA